MKTIANIRVGAADVQPTALSHVPGVLEGNAPGNLEGEDALIRQGEGALGTARRSTGINARNHGPIDPRMPNLSPA